MGRARRSVRWRNLKRLVDLQAAGPDAGVGGQRVGQARGIAPSDDDTVALPHQRLGQRAADAGIAAGDQCDTAFYRKQLGGIDRPTISNIMSASPSGSPTLNAWSPGCLCIVQPSFSARSCIMPMMVLPIVAVLGRIDQSLARAATSLGANPWRVFREVTWPLSRPGVVAGTVLVFMAHLTSFVTPLLLGQGKIQTYSTVAYQQAVEVLDYPFASAFALFPFVAVFGIWGLWVIASPGVRRLRGADAGGLGV